MRQPNVPLRPKIIGIPEEPTIGIFYKMNFQKNEHIYQPGTHEYSLVVGSPEAHKFYENNYGYKMVANRPVSVLPEKARTVLLNYYSLHTKNECDPKFQFITCGYMAYDIFSHQDKQTGNYRNIAYATDYYPKGETGRESSTLRASSKQTGLGAYLELMCLEHLHGREGITHLTTCLGINNYIRKNKILLPSKVEKVFRELTTSQSRIDQLFRRQIYSGGLTTYGDFISGLKKTRW